MIYCTRLKSGGLGFISEQNYAVDGDVLFSFYD